MDILCLGKKAAVLLSLSLTVLVPSAFGVLAGEEDGSPNHTANACWALKFANGNVTANADGTCSIADQGSGSGGEWTDGGTILYPNESASDEIAIGGTTEAAADIFLGVDGDTVFNKQGNTVDFLVEGPSAAQFFLLDGSALKAGISNAAAAVDVDTTFQVHTITNGDGPAWTRPDTTTAIDMVWGTGGALTTERDFVWRHVSGGTEKLVMYDNNATDALFTIRGDGSDFVGINTDSPVEFLHVYNDDHGGVYLERDAATNATDITWLTAGTKDWGIRSDNTAGDGDAFEIGEYVTATFTERMRFKAGGDVETLGLHFVGTGLDGIGAVDIDYGSADITDHTFVTDGTGTAEIVLPAGSIDSTELLDDTILEADLKAVDAASDEECLTYEAAGGDFEWQSCGGGGSGAFDDSADPIVQNTTTKDVHIGDGAGTLTAKLEVGGDADQPQVVIEGHSTQTDDVFIIQNDADTENFTISKDGDTAVHGYLQLYDATSGSWNIGDELQRIDIYSADAQSAAVEAKITFEHHRDSGSGHTTPTPAIVFYPSSASTLAPIKAGLFDSSGRLQLGSAEDTIDGVLHIHSEQGATDYFTRFQPGTQTQDVTYTLPNDDGTASQFLQTDGAGALTWASPAGSGDVTGVGDCTDGDCLDGTSDGGTYIRLYDGDSNYTEINNGDANQSADLKWVLPDTNGTAGQVLEIASVASDTITLEWDDDGGGGGTVTGITGFKSLVIDNDGANAAVEVDADKVVVANSSDEIIVLDDVQVTCTITTSGINGLEASDSEGADKWYEIQIRAQSDSTTGCLLNEAGTAVGTVPTSYDYHMIVGYVRNDSSSNFADFSQHGTIVNYDERYYNSGYFRALSGGTATSFTNVDLSSDIPPDTSCARVILSDVGDNHAVQVQKDGAQGTTFGSIVTTEQEHYCINVGTDKTGESGTDRTIEYIVASGGSLTIDVIGYELNL